MENKSNNSKKVWIIIAIVAVVILASIGVFAFIQEKIFLVKEISKFIGNTSSFVFSGDEDFDVEVDASMRLSELEEYKEAREIINNTKLEFDVRKKDDHLISALRLKNNEDKNILDATLNYNLDEKEDEMYLKVDQLSDKWIDLLSDKNIRDKYNEIKNKVNNNDESDLDKEINDKIISEITSLLDDIEIKKTKTKYMFKGKEVNAKAYSINISKAQIMNILNEILEEYAEEDEEDEDYDYDYELDDYYGLFDVEGYEDYNEFIGDDEDKEIEDYEFTEDYYTLTIYTKGFFNKRIIGASLENNICTSVNGMSCEETDEIFTESRINFYINDDITNTIEYIKYDKDVYNKINDYKEIEKVKIVLTKEEKNKTNIEVEYINNDERIFELSIQVYINKFGFVDEYVDKESAIKFDEVDFTKLQNLETLKSVESYENAKEKIENEKIKEKEELDQKELNEANEMKKTIEEETTKTVKKIQGSTFEMFKGDNVSYSVVSAAIEYVNQVNTLYNSNVSIKFNNETVSVEEANSRLNKDSKYSIDINYSEPEVVSEIIITIK